MSDHSQTAVERSLDLMEVLRDDWRILEAEDPAPEEAQLAVSPTARYGMVYALEEDERDRLPVEVMDRLAGVDGIDILARLDGDEAVVRSDRGELRFAPGGELVDRRGGAWSLDGEPATLGLRTEEGLVQSDDYPLALDRLWSALTCPDAGEVLISAAPGWELVDWGGAAHIGGGSHGSLHRDDSLGALIFCGTGSPTEDAPAQWTLRDVAPLVLHHFSLPS
jgi:hypothetical protein